MHTSPRYEALSAAIESRFGQTLRRVASRCGELTYEVEPAALIEAGKALRDEPDFAFEMLVDLCGVDYLTHGQAEWETVDATSGRSSPPGACVAAGFRRSGGRPWRPWPRASAARRWASRPA